MKRKKNKKRNYLIKFENIGRGNCPSLSLLANTHDAVYFVKMLQNSPYFSWGLAFWGDLCSKKRILDETFLEAWQWSGENWDLCHHAVSDINELFTDVIWVIYLLLCRLLNVGKSWNISSVNTSTRRKQHTSFSRIA